MDEALGCRVVTRRIVHQDGKGGHLIKCIEKAGNEHVLYYMICNLRRGCLYQFRYVYIIGAFTTAIRRAAVAICCRRRRRRRHAGFRGTIF